MNHRKAIPANGQQTQRQRDGACSFCEPSAGVRRIGRNGKPEEHNGARKQHREEYPGECSGARRLEFLIRQIELSVGHSVFTSELQPYLQRRDPTLDKIPAVVRSIMPFRLRKISTS
jgi:hypothetical protein